LAFNNPFGDRVATGSFDKTAKVFLFYLNNFKVWDVDTGK
jgi:hypothetical protein